MAQWVKNLPVNAGDTGDTNLIPGSGRFPGEGNGNLHQYSCLENPIDREALWATVQRVAKSWTECIIAVCSLDRYWVCKVMRYLLRYMKLHSMNFFQPLYVINQIISTIVKGSLSEMNGMRASCRALWMP